MIIGDVLWLIAISIFRGEEELEKSSILMYTTEAGITKVEVTFDNDTVWLSLAQIAKPYQKNKSTIYRHINNFFS